MRVLFCSTGGFGHIQPMRPLATAMQQQGDAVAWVTAPDALASLAGHGLTLFPAGLEIAAGRRMFRELHPWVLELSGEAISEQTFPRLFGATLAPSMLAGVGDTIDLWKPQLVVLEPAALAAPLACTQRRVPYVTHSYGLPVPPMYLEAAMRWFGPCWERAGLRAPDDGGLYRHLYIDIVPQGLTSGTWAGVTPRLALNPYAVRTDAGIGLPGELRQALEQTDRLRVYLSFGTVFNRRRVLVDAAQALLGTGAVVVVTTGKDSGPGDFPAAPNLHVLDFVDQAAVLSRCDLVVSHGGAGTILAAAAHGRPQIVLPQGADHFRNARALAEASVAIAVAPEEQTAHTIRKAAERLLSVPDFRLAARRLAQQMGRMPKAREIACELERRFSGS
ncbi:MAG: glycosyltransferase family 1 protein [Burkholderiales bacterium]|nr:glycosyltransferase family 1 protein [Burkholderiales bacterium]